MKKILAYALAAVMAVSGFVALAPVQADAATSPGDKIYREGSKTRNLKVNKTIELEVEKGRNLRDSDLWWSVSSGSSVVKITSSDRSDEDVTIKGLKPGTAKVKCKNKVTGGSLYYTVKVTKSSSSSAANKIYREGNATKNMKVGKSLELEVEKGRNVKDSDLWWTVSSGSSVVKITSSDRSDEDITIKALKAGTAKVKCKNDRTGGSLSYTIKVTKQGAYTISRVGSATKTVEVGDDLDVKVTKGSNLKSSQIQWSIGNTDILRFEDGDKTGTAVEVEAKKTGTTTVTANNLHTGGKIVYTVKVVPDYDD